MMIRKQVVVGLLMLPLAHQAQSCSGQVDAGADIVCEIGSGEPCIDDRNYDGIDDQDGRRLPDGYMDCRQGIDECRIYDWDGEE